MITLWNDKHVAATRVEHAAGLGYSRDFPLSKDWSVSYRKSHWGDVPCYYFVWSHIELIFIRPRDQRRLRE